MQKLMIVLMVCSLFFLQTTHADLLIVGAGGEAQIYGDNVSNVLNSTNTTTVMTTIPADLEKILRELAAVTTEKRYLEAIANRTQAQEENNNRVITALEKAAKNQAKEIQEKNEVITELRSDLEVFKETSNTRNNDLQQQLDRETYAKYIYILISIVATWLIFEYIDSLTRKKKLYFRLVKWRTQFPINTDIITGPRKE